MKTLVLFDFDGTMTYEDSSNAFFKFIYTSKVKYLFFNYILCFKELLFLGLKLSNYLILKKKRLSIHTSKFNNYQLEFLSSEFRSKVFDQILIPNAINKLFWHKNQGHDIWIVSASYDFILEKWASKIEVNVLTNKTFFDNKTRIIVGNDVNFEEKVNRLRNLINLDEFQEVYAYGDSEGDKYMLEIATRKFYRFFN